MVRWALRTMESAVYYPHTKVETAHDNGIQVVMTPRLDSDVPVGYFSWAEYNFGQAAPQAEDQSTTMASAVISNCGGSSHRLTSINSLEGNGVSMDKFGSCFQNRYQGSKYDVIKKYKFHMAFENSIEKDYVTEKYLQALVVGVVPVVIGAPNIHDFIPSPNSVLYIPSAEDAPRVAEQIKYLWNNETAYKEMLAWKTDGPWAPFLALVDMAVVHSSCRLCIHQATKMYLKELNEKIDQATGSCLCKEAGKASRRYYHRLLVRERGTFEFISVTVTKKSLQSKITLKDLFSTIINTFKEAVDPFLPVWYGHRKDYRKSAEELEIYKIYPVGLTQRAALYGKEAIDTDEDVDLLLAQPCPKLEVIFV
jgi:glycoprotein 3-alpha-L-fucosyltransferase